MFQILSGILTLFPREVILLFMITFLCSCKLQIEPCYQLGGKGKLVFTSLCWINPTKSSSDLTVMDYPFHVWFFFFQLSLAMFEEPLETKTLGCSFVLFCFCSRLIVNQEECVVFKNLRIISTLILNLQEAETIYIIMWLMKNFVFIFCFFF